MRKFLLLVAFTIGLSASLLPLADSISPLQRELLSAPGQTAKEPLQFVAVPAERPEYSQTRWSRRYDELAQAIQTKKGQLSPLPLEGSQYHPLAIKMQDLIRRLETAVEKYRTQYQDANNPQSAAYLEMSEIAQELGAINLSVREELIFNQWGLSEKEATSLEKDILPLTSLSSQIVDVLYLYDPREPHQRGIPKVHQFKSWTITPSNWIRRIFVNKTQRVRLILEPGEVTEQEGMIEIFQRDQLAFRELFLSIQRLYFAVTYYYESYDAHLTTLENDAQLLAVFDEELTTLVDSRRRLQEIQRRKLYQAAKYQNFHSKIETIAEETETLIEFILEVRGSREYSASTLDIRRLTKSVEGSLQAELEEHGVRLQGSIDEGLEQWESTGDVFSYPAILNEGLTELIRNAIKYSGTADIYYHLSLINDGELLVLVQNFGGGMPEEIQRKVFAPGETQDRLRGTGMGMYELRSHLWEVGGDIDFISEEEEGTLFGFILPVSMPNHVTTHRRLNRQISMDIGGLRGSQKKQLARALSARLNLRYLNPGFLLRALVFKMKEEGIPLDNPGEVVRYVSEFLAQGRINYDEEPVHVDGINTLKPRQGESANYRDLIRFSVDGDPAMTRFLHRFARFPEVEEAVREFKQRLIGGINHGRSVNGVVQVITDPRDSASEFRFFLHLPTDIRASRVNLNPEALIALDRETNRENIRDELEQEQGVVLIDASRTDTREMTDQIIEILEQRGIRWEDGSPLRDTLTIGERLSQLDLTRDILSQLDSKDSLELSL